MVPTVRQPAWDSEHEPEHTQSDHPAGAGRHACKKLQPKQQITTAEREAALKQLLQLSRCMRAHGITDFPDPTTKGGGVGLHLGANMDPDSPQFQAAQKACHMPGP
jgi:hypothetical protein